MTGSHSDDTNMLTRHFVDGFAALRPAVPIHIWGGDFDPETDAKSGGDYIRYVRISNAVLTATTRGVGQPFSNPRGEFSAEIFSPKSLQGSGYINEIVDDIADVMKHRRLGNLILRAPYPSGPPFDEGIWWRQLVTCPWDSHHIP